MRYTITEDPADLAAEVRSRRSVVILPEEPPMNDRRSPFHRDLDLLRADIVRLAALVTELIPRGTEVLLSGNLSDAQAVIEDDDELDLLSLDIEERCYHMLTLQQPVASDLRALVTAIRLVSEIERSGDLMVNVAKAARRIYDAELDPKLRGLIERMGEEAARLFKLSIDAYAEENAGLAAALDDLDDRLDTLHREFIAAIFESRQGTALELQPAVQLALVGRYYERIGDHAVNIGTRVQYMVTGWLPEHGGAARLEARRRQAAVRAVEEEPVLRLAEAEEGTVDGTHGAT
jgi:phosphate transport system protein